MAKKISELATSTSLAAASLFAVVIGGTTVAVNGTEVASFVLESDSEINAISGLTSAADKGIYFTGSGTASTYDLTTAGRALTDDATASAQRTTLGLDSIGSDGLRVLRPVASPPGGAITATTGRAFCNYVGYLAQAKVIKFVRANMTTAGSGAQTAEVALASSPNAPTQATNQTFTFLSADGTLSDLTTGAPKLITNTSALNSGSGYTVAAGTHLWACMRTAMATTQPAFTGGANDLGGNGMMISNDDSIGALTSATTYTFKAHVGGATGSGAPLMTATMD